MDVLAAVLGLVAVLWTAVVVAFSGPLRARWREPVFRHPVLAIESDDWGAGPLEQAAALAQLADMLSRVRDRCGRPALMTLGVIFEVPDGPRIAATGCTEYHALTLTDARFDAVRAAMQAGIATGVFVPQLHGQCHYWPPAVLAAAERDAAVRDWLTGAAPAATEALPSNLQSRWTDASVLPSRPLADAAIGDAVADEVGDYQCVFGSRPPVAIATTFVWNDAVEAAWARAGVEAIVTPGRRATCRNAAGEPGCVDAVMLTGECSGAGPLYLVRDVYFEPALGHTPQRLAQDLARRTRQGRVCLVETHRFNFLHAGDASLAALEAGLAAALVACPMLRFAAPTEIARAVRQRDPEWIETRLRPRITAWRARLDEIPRFRRLSRLTGLALPLGLMGARA